MASRDAQEDTCVPSRIARSESGHGETDYGDDSLDSDEWCAETQTVGQRGEGKGDDDGSDVRRGTEQLTVANAVTHAAEDDGKEVGECVGGHGAAHEEQSEGPKFEIQSVFAGLGPGQRVVLAVATVGLDPRAHQCGFRSRKERVLVWEVYNKEPGRDC